jgi:hypothetical protein
MIAIHDGHRFRRRAFLTIGGLALGGLSLTDLVKARAASDKQLICDKSIIFLFLHGGPSQTETFDPKMSAPVEIRSTTGEIATKLPGITFGGTFPKLAARADKVTVVRSFVPGDANHEIKPIVCRDRFNANLGSIYARMAGSNRASNGMPTNVALFPRAVEPSTQKANLNFGKFDSTGPFGLLLTSTT